MSVKSVNVAIIGMLLLNFQNSKIKTFMLLTYRNTRYWCCWFLLRGPIDLS